MKTMTLRRMMVTAAGLLIAIPGDASAQEQVGCFRGRPLPACKTFWVVEMQGFVPIVQATRTLTYYDQDMVSFQYELESFEEAVEWNLGHMVNVGSGYAIGGILTAGTGNSDPLTGIKVRGRKWLGENLSVELEAGLLRNDAGGGQFGSVNGWTSDVRLNVRDQGSFFVRYDGVSVPQSSVIGPYGSFDPGGVDQGFSVGVSAGSVPALIGTGALAGFLAVLMASLWND